MRIVASNNKVIYHGDNYNTTKLDPKLMDNGNNQEGIGIYFGNLDTAQSYGKNIVTTSIDVSKFIPAYDDVGEHINIRKITSLLSALHKLNNEHIYYMVTDWGLEVGEPEDITLSEISFLAKKLQNEQVRDFQTDLAGKFGVENFVREWNKHIKIDGTYTVHPVDTWYAVINPNYKLEKVK